MDEAIKKLKDAIESIHYEALSGTTIEFRRSNSLLWHYHRGQRDAVEALLPTICELETVQKALDKSNQT